jgi:predicted pyridoxine 5'-phosphate oxidase superfamily flavin-nucleotide-binding protein
MFALHSLPPLSPPTSLVAMLSSEVSQFASRSVLCWLATVDADGQPNVSPKEIFTVFDSEHLVIANIASPTSVRNIEVHPRVCVSFVDVFVQKGFKVFGTASNVRRQDDSFSSWAAPLEAKAGPRFPIHSVLVIRASAVEAILAPSYRLYAAETTEQGQVAAAMRTYGVMPASP